jgi:hypothetical protein
MSTTKILAVMGAGLTAMTPFIRIWYGVPIVGTTLGLFVVALVLAKLLDGRRFKNNAFTRNYFRTLSGIVGFSWSSLFTVGLLTLAGPGLALFAAIMVVYVAFGALLSAMLNAEFQKGLQGVHANPMGFTYGGITGLPLGKYMSRLLGR